MVNHQTPNLHLWIADYYTARPADFVVMDALQGLQHGPTPSFDMSGVRNISEAQLNMRTILASADGLAIDVVQTNIMNWCVDSVLYLRHLTEAGIVGNGNSQNITVLGVRVDDIRRDFAGVIPVTGGRRLTARDRTPPEITIESAEIHGSHLHLYLNLSATTDKIDIYIDGVYLTSVSGAASQIYIKTRELLGQSREITIYAYDRRMHHTSASVTARNAKLGDGGK
jgi:hypothetical protein